MILVILTMTKYCGNLLTNRISSWLFIAKQLFILGSLKHHSTLFFETVFTILSTHSISPPSSHSSPSSSFFPFLSSTSPFQFLLLLLLSYTDIVSCPIFSHVPLPPFPYDLPYLHTSSSLSAFDSYLIRGFQRRARKLYHSVLIKIN